MHSLKRPAILTILAVFVASFITTSIPVQALQNGELESLCAITAKNEPSQCLEDFYSGNDVLYYDPNAVACDPTQPGSTGSVPVIGNDNPEKIYNFLTGKGLSGEQAAGILGNFQQESGFDPAIIQGGQIAGDDYIPVNSVGFGLAQWTFTARQQPLVDLARSSNRKITDLMLQLDYLWQELTTIYQFSLDNLKKETTPERAAYVFHRDYEGSADSEAAVIAVRGGNARELFEKYKGNSSATTGSNTCGPQAGSGGALTDFMSEDFKIYNQCQYEPYGGPWGTKLTPRGGTICAEGCIPTSLAMIAKNLAGQNVTPEETTKYYTDNSLWYASGPGAGLETPPTAALGFGMTAEVIANKGDIAGYKAVFDKGGLIMAISTGPSPFLPGRHAIVLRGITPEGNFMIADPGYVETNKPPANQPSVDQILTSIRGDGYSVSYAFYKK